MLRLSLALTLAASGTAQEVHRHFAFDAPLRGLPAGWMITTPSHRGAVGDTAPHAGAGCLTLSPRAGAAGTGIALTQLDAEPLRGKRIRIIGALRAGPGGSAQLWLRVDRQDGRRGAFDNMADRPVRSATWQQVELEVEVDADATGVTVGLMAPNGAAALDELSVVIVGPITPPEGPRALEARGLTNLVAFARLYGCVRWFHPSDAVANADWDRLAVEGVRASESAKDATQFASALGVWLAPLAPTARLLAPGEPLPPVVERDGEDRVAFWTHAGVGLGSSQVYESRRRRLPLARALAAGAAHPDAPHVVELGDGLRCLLPLSLWHEAALRTDPPPVGRTPGNGRAARLASVVQAWNVFQHFYPYFEHTDADWPAELERALTAMALAPDAAGGLPPLRRMVAALRDGHGGVWHSADPDTASLPLAAEFVGEQLVVTAVAGTVHGLDGAHLRPGDPILALGDEPLAVASARLAPEISAATPQFQRSRLAAALLRGPPGQLRLEVEGADGERHSFRMARVATPPPIPPRPEPIADVADGVVYVDIERVDDDALRAALPRLVAAHGVVFDFRGYPGKLSPQVLFEHLIESPVASARWIVPDTTRPDRADVRLREVARWNLTPSAPRLTAKLAFAVDGRAISYAESCLGIVEHYRLGALVGEASAGTNGNVNPLTTVGRYHVAWTGMVVRKHDGAVHHGVGIAPTHPVARTRAGIREGRDEALAAAIALVQR